MVFGAETMLMDDVVPLPLVIVPPTLNSHPQKTGYGWNLSDISYQGYFYIHFKFGMKYNYF